MAKKLHLRDRAMIALGDFCRDASESDIQAKMLEIAAETGEEVPAAVAPKKKDKARTIGQFEESTKRRAAGRPKKEDEPRDKVFTCRLPESVYWLLKEKAASRRQSPADLIIEFVRSL